MDHNSSGSKRLLFLFALVASSAISLWLEGCTQAQVSEIQAKMAQLTPSTTYTFTGGNNEKYVFVTHQSTVSDITDAFGPPKRTTAMSDGGQILFYRKFHDLKNYNSGNAYENGRVNSMNWLQIEDMTFIFDKNSLLLSAKTEDKTRDPDAIREVRAEEAKQSTAPRAPTTSAPKQLTADIQNRFEMSLIEIRGKQACGWPLTSNQEAAAKRRIAGYAEYMNNIDYRARVNSGMTIKDHNSTAEFCLDEREKHTFDAAKRYLHD